MTFYAICDCDSCYVSCERVFRPDLMGKTGRVLEQQRRLRGGKVA